MKTITVKNEGWFKQADFHDVKMLGITHLEIPADKFIGGKEEEASRRTLVRQVFKQKGHEYGEEFEIVEPSNPFGTPGKRKSQGASGASSLTGTYSFVKSGLRAKEDDIRWEMEKVIKRNTSFKDLITDWEKTHEPNEKFTKSGDKGGKFTFIEQVQWALKRGWIIRTGE